MQEQKVNLPEELVKLRSQNEGLDDADEKTKGEEVELKENAKVHYDKEDLISFHQLFISKPLTKAAHELDYEHPTVI